MRFLILGMPRGGTKYMSMLMHRFGYDVRHEKLGNDGVSAFQWVTRAEQYPVYGLQPLGAKEKAETLIHAIREPVACIASAVATLNPATKGYLRKYAPQFSTWNERDNMALVYLYWHALIHAQGADLTVRVEDAVEPLAEFLEKPAPKNLPDTNTNTRPHAPLSIDDFRPEIQEALSQFCRNYGYEVAYAAA